MPYCPGCGNEFAYTGIEVHLAKSKNPSCHQVYDNLYKFAPGTSSPDNRRSQSPPLFPGDFFGTAEQYHSDDSSWNDNDKMVVDDDGGGNGNGDGGGNGNGNGNGSGDGDGNEDGNEDRDGDGDGGGDGDGLGDGNGNGNGGGYDDDDDDFDYLENDFGNGWEPDIANQEPVNEPGEMEDDLPLEDNSSQSMPAKFVAGTQLCSEPVVVVKFPDANAGASYHTDDNSGYHDYQTRVKNPESPWAPFKSRMEWEIARWAKIRGPGSTAFDELIQIQGVSCYNYLYCI
jgi:hypothetical protein